MLVQLVSGDGDVFTVDSKVLAMSKLLNNMLKNYDEDSDLEPIVLNSISTMVLAKILDYCRYHENNPAPPIPKPLKSNNLEDVVCSWDQEFINVDTELLFEIIKAENFLDIKPLLDLSCAKIASMVKGKTPDEIRDQFNITNDFTPEEEALTIGSVPVMEQCIGNLWRCAVVLTNTDTQNKPPNLQRHIIKEENKWCEEL